MTNFERTQIKLKIPAVKGNLIKRQKTLTKTSRKKKIYIKKQRDRKTEITKVQRSDKKIQSNQYCFFWFCLIIIRIE
jgi:hypothetical protein